MCNLNEIETIEQSLNSLKKQTFRPMEIVVVDGGSTDGSLEVAEALADKVYGPVKRLGIQRLYGIHSSQGSLICCANSDTIYPKRYLENALRHLLNPEVEGVTGPCMPIPGTRFNLTAQAQGALSHILYFILLHVYEHNLCFKKDAFVKPCLPLRGYWMRAVTGSTGGDIGHYVKYALKCHWKKDMLVYTRLPTRGVSLRGLLKFFLRYLKKGHFVSRRWISKR